MSDFEMYPYLFVLASALLGISLVAALVPLVAAMFFASKEKKSSQNG